jgi:CRISPR-associated RAMP protein (TIGR02581 family)
MKHERSEPILGMRAFHRRLILRGTLKLNTGLRVGAGRDPAIETSELPVVKTEDGQPYVPGTSFKGAWRATTEKLLRGIQAEMGANNLACLSVPRQDRRPEEERETTCLYQAEVSWLKSTPFDRWHTHQRLGDRFAQVADLSLDEALRVLSCYTCRVFGAPWLSGKVLIKDLKLPLSWEGLVEASVRDGVAIDRDKGTAADNRKFAYEVVPPETPFEVEIVLENTSDAELGLAWLGLMGFQQGQIPLGGARSRGLGWCTLAIDWEQSRWLTRDHLVESVFPRDSQQPVGVLSPEEGSGETKRWSEAFLRKVGLGGNDDV